MLHGACNHAGAAKSNGGQGAADRQCVRFGAAGGEHNLAWAGMKQLRHLLSGQFNGRACPTSLGVQAGWIPPRIPQMGLHRLEDARVHGRGGGVVEVDTVGHVIFPMNAVTVECPPSV